MVSSGHPGKWKCAGEEEKQWVRQRVNILQPPVVLGSDSQGAEGHSTLNGSSCTGRRNNSKKGSAASAAKSNSTIEGEEEDSICQKDGEPDLQRYFSTYQMVLSS